MVFCLAGVVGRNNTAPQYGGFGFTYFLRDINLHFHDSIFSEHSRFWGRTATVDQWKVIIEDSYFINNFEELFWGAQDGIIELKDSFFDSNWGTNNIHLIRCAECKLKITGCVFTNNRSVCWLLCLVLRYMNVSWCVFTVILV